ncbi:MAG: hypothetical protein A2805_01685 [Candidatus Andersenbacteria bacterium RIFCSPHIGHO2_01_FULL_46_36]|uniref:Thioredoxin domain-containing protein n=1 Tax=Candidatus Andersenbacteria bacterium RIFCSPHIGHO2_12_FULL_45_11 TaxID=1797281 RepID=A0A1G1X3S0_9BACT|nr:MAG: hypothetical protein A2805_01685 [Candidatus Andersenbacteria bacterium RIFCSPHIGHO2_01_FULL_46_36]OGY34666.1 MAG: hypothetical protein A3D99_04990 [Candidatus Andersenbacteria bacterium RIFCSPHIGHO2_12_FULL_45_11]
MNTFKISLAILGVIIIAGGVYAVKMKKSEQSDDYTRGTQGVMQQEEGVSSQMPIQGAEDIEEMVVNSPSPEAMGDGTVTVAVQSGPYIPYDSTKLSLADEGSVVLFFRAPWCPTCKALDADITANLNTIPGGVTILDVDYDTSTELKQKYGVTYQHTLVQVDAQGNMIKKWSGSPTLVDLLGQIQSK